jgi:hypothetical protein
MMTGTASSGARTPEELETLFEDALLLRDTQALAMLFEEGAVLVVGDEQLARGAEAVARQALALWYGEHMYLANPWQIVQTRETAVIVAAQGINVARRSGGAWRYAITLVRIDEAAAGQDA